MPDDTPQPTPAGPSQSPDESNESQVTLRVRLAPGTRLKVTLETEAGDGTLVSVQQLVFGDAPPGPGQSPLEPGRPENQSLPALQSPPAPVPPPAPLHGLPPKPDLLQSGPAPAGTEGRPILAGALRSLAGRADILFVGALLIYLFTRLYAIASYPIYFFTDEAVQTVLAADFLRDGLHNYVKELLPTYFQNVYQYNLSVSVYLQVIPFLLFGKSVEVTRSTAALVTILAPLSVGLIFQKGLGSSRPWLAALVLSILPAWFLHSRTAFETSLGVSFYALFLYFYLRYRLEKPGPGPAEGPALRREPKKANIFAAFAAGIFAKPSAVRPGKGLGRGWGWLMAAILAGALSFYSYSPAQMVMLVTGVLLLGLDLRHHLRQPLGVKLAAVGLLALAALPYLRFQAAHPGESLHHLIQIGSYWTAPIPLGDKLLTYLGQYLSGLNPLYWFVGNVQDLPRHTMDGLGHLLVYSIPFAGIGLVKTIRRALRPGQAAYRVVLVAILAAPSGAALVGMGITRALFMVVPAALLTALGLETCLGWLGRLPWLKAERLSGAAWLGLAGANLLLLWAALTAGPTWTTDYTLGGMQYGARQVFAEIAAFHAQNPQAQVVLSPAWANGTDVVARFFEPDPPISTLVGINTYLNRRTDFNPDTLFILPPDEYQRAVKSGKFAEIQIVKTLLWPDGRPGFYFLHLRYADDVDARFARDLEERKAVLAGAVTVAGEQLAVHYSALDMGKIEHLFDGDLNTLVRGAAANPFKLQIDFPQGSPHSLSELDFAVGATATTLDVTVQVAGESTPRAFHLEAPEDQVARLLEVKFGERLAVTSFFILMKNTNDPEPGHVHLWELSWK